MAKAKKLASGNWRTLAYLGSVPEKDNGEHNILLPDGRVKMKRVYKSYTAPTRKESERLASMAEKEAMNCGRSMTVSQAINRYIESKEQVLSPSTVRHYKTMQRNYYWEIGNIKISDVTADMLQSWVNEKSVGRSPKSVRNISSLALSSIHMFRPSFAVRLTLPQKIKPDLYVPTDSDVKAVINYFTDKGDKDMLRAVCLAAFGSLRRSEICGLVADRDVDGQRIHVRRAVVRAFDGSWKEKTTKTESSDRVVSVPRFVSEILPETGPVVELNPNIITDRFSHGLKHLGVEHFRFHDLRHYYASIMHAIGIPDQYIMESGGWESDHVLKAVYRGTMSDYKKKYTEKALDYFQRMI